MSSIKASVFFDSKFQPDMTRFLDTEQITKPDKETLKTIVYKRAEEVYPNFQNALFTNIRPESIKKNSLLPNVRLWMALKHLAHYPVLVKNMFLLKSDEKRGKYTVYLNKRGVKVEVEIDTMLPFIRAYEGLIPAFTQIDGDDIWPLLVEKAISKLDGNFDFFFSTALLIQTRISWSSMSSWV
jgi:hypothetical protein